MPDLQQLQDSYLKDHFAAATAGRDLFRRTAHSHSGSDLGAALSVLADEVDADRDAQLAIMRDVGVEPSASRAVVGAVVERVGRLKPNATVLSRSPLTDVVELEALRVAVCAKACGWEALLAASVADHRLSKVRIEELLARAHDQLDRLRDLHVQVARQRFVDAAGGPG